MKKDFSSKKIKRTIFSDSLLKTSEENKVIMLLKALKEIIKNKTKLFISCSLLAIITAIINFNISINVRNNFTSTKKIIKNSLDSSSINVKDKKDFIFEIKLIKKSLIRENLNFWQFIFFLLTLVLIIKGVFSYLHYYLMSYSYDSIEGDLKKDLFSNFIRADYSNSSEVSNDLITQFSSHLDSIAYDIWFIPNRLIYVFTSIFYTIYFDFNFGSEGKLNLKFLSISLLLFFVLIIAQTILFKKSARLNLEAQKRLEEDNKKIYQRIKALEYIKILSAEEEEEETINNQLNNTFEKNRRALFYDTLFKAVPNYLITPNIPIFFLMVCIFFVKEKVNEEIFYVVNFFLYFQAVRSLTNEVNKIIDSLTGIGQFSSNLIIVKRSVEALRKSKNKEIENKITFEKGNIIFKNVSFSYPGRPQKVLDNISFTFNPGNYMIVGKNGKGKSSFTKLILKIYSLEENKGEILIGENKLEEINTESIHYYTCHQTNKINFLPISIAQNVLYPGKYIKDKHLERLNDISKKVGIYDFISNLPNGWDTILKEEGRDLSEGQKQQISSMRIFMRDNYHIYIFDEILSNVHPELREKILWNISKELKNKGKIIIWIDHHVDLLLKGGNIDEDKMYEFTGEDFKKIDKKDLISPK